MVKFTVIHTSPQKNIGMCVGILLLALLLFASVDCFHLCYEHKGQMFKVSYDNGWFMHKHDGPPADFFPIKHKNKMYLTSDWDGNCYVSANKNGYMTCYTDWNKAREATFKDNKLFLEGETKESRVALYNGYFSKNCFNTDCIFENFYRC